MPNPRISVVSPFYNEEAILKASVAGMLANLAPFGDDVELIIVDDGSTDGSKVLAENIAEREPRVRLISYDLNRGRGHALKTGIDAAWGEIIVTTEVDLSWGDDIVARLVSAMDDNPKLDMIIASPNLPTGGYKNVPAKRRLLSNLGNALLRMSVSRRITMYTGMTRAYRAALIQSLSTAECGKEFHLEVALKALTLGWNVGEIPCVLEWKDHKLQSPNAQQKRKSSTHIPSIIQSHLVFSCLANPSRYLTTIAVAPFLLSLFFFIIGLARLLTNNVAIYFFLSSGILFLISMNLFIFSILAGQNSTIRAECWRVQNMIQADSSKTGGKGRAQ
jgi:glycosyltransferase involved in cell wall biosynthesis